MNFYIIRHGNPDYCRDCLTELGHTQAIATAEELANLGIDEIYSSPMGRAKETAQPLCNLLGKEIHIEPWAAEVEHYSSNGCRTVQLNGDILRSPEMDALGENWTSHPIFGGAEGVNKMVNTIEYGAADLLARNGYVLEGKRFKIIDPNEKSIALFCHAGVFLVLTSFLLQIPQLTAWHSFFVNQASISFCHFPNFETGYTIPRFYYVNNYHHITDKGIQLS